MKRITEQACWSPTCPSFRSNSKLAVSRLKSRPRSEIFPRLDTCPSRPFYNADDDISARRRRRPASLVVLGIIDTKFHGFKGPRLYAERAGGRAEGRSRRWPRGSNPLTTPRLYRRTPPSRTPRDPASSVRTILAHGQILSIQY